MVFQVLYEKLPKFCEVCGLFGHGGLECDDGVHDEEAKQYGAWMVAPMGDWHPQTSGVRGRQKEENGGGGQGAKPPYRKRPPGESPPAARTSTQAKSNLMELTDGKVDGAMVRAPGARKNLGMDMEAEANSTKVGAASPVKPDPKRPRRNEENTEEAGSLEERRQAQ
jgi:hypothetical protein